VRLSVYFARILLTGPSAARVPPLQIEYIKDEQRHLKREMLRAQEVRRGALVERVARPAGG
jgi:hypothetical protein